MADFPALPLWTADFLADTAHLSDAEVGLYTRLLITIWRAPQCRIPNDDKWLSRKLNQPPEVYRPIITEFCKSTGNWITQKRLLREFNWVKNKSKINSDAAKSRWNKEKDTSERNAPTPILTPTHNGNGNGKAKFPDLRVGRDRDGVTIKDPAERLARFQKTLAESFPENGWMIVAAATDPSKPEFGKCLALCKEQALRLGKGWPRQWPVSA